MEQQISDGAKFLLKWIAGTFIGFWLAPIVFFVILGGLWEIIVQLLSNSPGDSIVHPILNAIFPILFVIAGLMMSASVGLAQWDLTLKNTLSKRAWIGASAFIGVTGLVGLTFGSLWLPSIVRQSGPSQASGFYVPYEVSGNWHIGVIGFGIVLGCAIGLPHWLILRRYVQNARWWLLGNIAGLTAIGLMLVVFVNLIENFVLALPATYCFGAPIAFGAITGLVLFNLLKHGKHSHAE